MLRKKVNHKWKFFHKIHHQYREIKIMSQYPCIQKLKVMLKIFLIFSGRCHHSQTTHHELSWFERRMVHSNCGVIIEKELNWKIVPTTKHPRYTRHFGRQSIFQCSWLREGVPAAATSPRFKTLYSIHNTMGSVWMDLCAIFTNKRSSFFQQIMKTCLSDFRDKFVAPNLDDLLIY